MLSLPGRDPHRGVSPGRGHSQAALLPRGFSWTDFRFWPPRSPGDQGYAPTCRGEQAPDCVLDICERSVPGAVRRGPRVCPPRREFPGEASQTPAGAPPGQGCPLLCLLLCPLCLDQCPTHSRPSGNYVLVLSWVGVSPWAPETTPKDPPPSAPLGVGTDPVRATASREGRPLTGEQERFLSDNHRLDLRPAAPRSAPSARGALPASRKP